jgi:hypothetical protein
MSYAVNTEARNLLTTLKQNYKDRRAKHYHKNDQVLAMQTIADHEGRHRTRTPIGIATDKHKTLSPQREPAIIATMQSAVPRQASQMAWSPEAQSAIASGFDSDASTQSIASTLSSSSRPASPIATFQIPPSHPCI